MNTDPVREFLQSLAAKAPTVGRRVQVTKGEREGVCGVVTWHGADKFNPPTRYVAEQWARDKIAMMGTTGYRVRVQPEGGGEQFFTGADCVAISEG